MEFDTDEITVGMFTEADARKKKMAGAQNAAGVSISPEFDNGLQVVMGMQAIVAVNSGIAMADLERIKGSDITKLMRIGLCFFTGKSVELSRLKRPADSSVITQESSTQQSETSSESD